MGDSARAADGNDAWGAFVARIDGARRQVGFESWEVASECYFRGHRDCTWSLHPTLHRTLAARSVAETKRAYALWRLEYDLFYEFQARARELHDSSITSWDVLFAMQHFGVPTRLLDWTETFAVAVHFAVDGWKDGANEPCIWVLNPTRLNQWGWGTDELLAPKYLGWEPEEDEFWGYDELLNTTSGLMEWDEPCAIYPEMKNARLQAQRGSFVIQGDVFAPLDQQLPKDNHILRKVVIPREAIAGARRFLTMAGIHHEVLFPDLGGLAKSLRTKYRIDAP